MTLHKITEFDTVRFTVVFQITLKIHIIAIFEPFAKQNIVSNKTYYNFTRQYNPEDNSEHLQFI
jgi:hypothetical protein